MRLTEAQKKMLVWLASQPKGVTDITDEWLVKSLIRHGLALKFHESDGGPLLPVWCITEAGRVALKKSFATAIATGVDTDHGP